MNNPQPLTARQRYSALLLSPIKRSEQLLEQLLFNARPLVVLAFLLLTAWLASQALQIRPDASLVKMIPAEHPYVENYLEHRDDLAGLGNRLRVVVAAKQGDIFSAEFLETLKQITDEAFFISGVDRSSLQSIWTPNVRWTQVTEEGFVGGPVIPPDYNGSAESIAQVRTNVLRSGQVGILVANDFRSAMISLPLFDKDPDTGEKLGLPAVLAESRATAAR